MINFLALTNATIYPNPVDPPVALRLDLSSLWENTRIIRDRIESGEVPGPRIRSNGEGLISSGSQAPDYLAQVMGGMKVRDGDIIYKEKELAAKSTKSFRALH
jgi:hypothetical protein